MQSSPHPHLNPQQPREGSQPGTNPPVFVWKPDPGQDKFILRIEETTSSSGFRVSFTDLREPIYLPAKAFAPGNYRWSWQPSGGQASNWSHFQITKEAALVEVPEVEEWKGRIPIEHPRLSPVPLSFAALEKAFAADTSDIAINLRREARLLEAQSHHLAEPPFLPDKNSDYEGYFSLWAKIMWDSRRFVKGAETLALAGLLEGNPAYSRSAAKRMASMALWDPDGSSHPSHSSEAQMSPLWHGSKACDWAWSHFSAEERERVIRHYRRRGANQLEELKDLGYYGVTRFDSHSGRKIVFLAMLGIVFLHEIPEAEEWLRWLRPIVCGVWPVWAGDDGAWAEGIAYSTAYVDIMAMGATWMKFATGIDLFQRPFWKNHLEWRRLFFPAYAEWIGFGDHSERWASTWQANADLVEHISLATAARGTREYIDEFRAETFDQEDPPERIMPGVCSELLVLRLIRACSGPQGLQAAEADPGTSMDPASFAFRVFPYAGWTAIRTAPLDRCRDVAFFLRCSPLGSISHAHASNNDFILHVGGKVLLMPSGFYDGYGSNHHAHWVWHTRSHNCVTLSEAGQIMRSPHSAGSIQNALDSENFTYFSGVADASYADRALICRRHVVFFKAENFILLLEQFVEKPDLVSSLQTNFHSWYPIQWQSSERSFRIEADRAGVTGHFLYHLNAYATLTEGWDPPPHPNSETNNYPQQYHLRFSTNGFGNRHLGILLCPEMTDRPAAKVKKWQEGLCECAAWGDCTVRIHPPQQEASIPAPEAILADITLGGKKWQISGAGLQ